jgi:molecular chaperone HscB
MIKCPSCARSQQPRLICQNCGAPLVAEVDYFAALGFAHKLSVDLSALERAYHELGRKIHPDRFAAAGVRVRDASLKATALLTRSYRTLRDPINRGRYWLELNGEKLAENNKRVPPELVEMVFEVQDQLAELRASAGAGDAAELRRGVEERRRELAATMDGLMAALDRNFARWDTEPRDDRKELVAELKMILSKIAYLRTLMRDVDRELEDLKAA